MEFHDVKIFRIIHIENIPHVLKFGLTHKDSPNWNPNFKNIGDLSLIDTRNRKIVTIDNGDYGSAVTQIILGDYIPFYFGVRMPMLYVSQIGGNFVEKATSSENIIYLVSSVEKIIYSGNQYYFSDGHATDMLTSFYDESRINDLVNIIDWDAVKSPYWGGAENLNLKRKKQAEFLVAGDISPKLIIGFGCYNENAKNALIKFGIDQNLIKIIPKAYY